MKFDELYKKVIDSCKAFEERQVPISLDFKIEDLRDALVESNDTIEKLKKELMPCLNGDCILTCEVVEKYGKENAELKQKLEDVQAYMYCDVVDANMENRRLRRALWLVRAYRAKAIYTYWHVKCIEGHLLYEHKWIVVERKCRAKAEEYK